MERNIFRPNLTTVLVILIVVYVIYRFYVSGFYNGNLNVAGNTLVVDSLNKFVGILTNTPSVALDVNGSASVSNDLVVNGFATIDSGSFANQLQIPIDTTATVTEGALQFSTSSDSLQVYKTSSGWVDVGGKIPIAETVAGLVDGVDDPLNVSALEATFSAPVSVNSEATFNAATAAAAENARIRLSASFACASVLTIPNKALWVDLNGFTLTVPISTTASIICQQAGKNIYFSNGTIQYAASGTTGSSSSIISASNCFLYIRNVTILHAEYAVTIAGTLSNRVIFYTSGSTFTMVKARSSANNTYRPIGLFGMTTDDSYVYVRGCTFDTLLGDTFLTTSTDRYIMRGVVNCSNSTHLSGSCTITGCSINPAHAMQAVFYSDVFSSSGTRGSFRLNIDNNTIGNAGVREQLIILVGYRPLNCFSSIYILENTFTRMDSNKGIMYIDNVSGGSTDVYIFNNTVPVMKTVSAISFASTYTRDSGTTVNVVTPSAHNFTVGYTITISGSAGGLSNGTYIIQSIVSPTEFTIIDTVSGAATGTTTVNDNYASSTRQIVSKDGYVRGPSTLTNVYLQKYTV